VKRTISRPKEILISFMKATFLCEFRIYRAAMFRCPEVGSRGHSLLCSDRFRAFCHNQHSQYGCCIRHASRNAQKSFRHGRMLICQPLKPSADTVKLIDLAQDRRKRHGQTALSLKSLRWENFRWTGLGQKT